MHRLERLAPTKSGIYQLSKVVQMHPPPSLKFLQISRMNPSPLALLSWFPYVPSVNMGVYMRQDEFCVSKEAADRFFTHRASLHASQRPTFFFSAIKNISKYLVCTILKRALPFGKMVNWSQFVLRILCSAIRMIGQSFTALYTWGWSHQQPYASTSAWPLPRCSRFSAESTDANSEAARLLVRAARALLPTQRGIFRRTNLPASSPHHRYKHQCL
jgi:hypothetical protein